MVYWVKITFLDFFFFFISTSFGFTFLTLKSYKHIDLKVFEVINLNSSNQKSKDFINLIYIFFIFYLLLNFFDFEKKNFIYVDVYHYGFQLVPSMNFTLTNKLWSSSFVEAGFFSNYMSLLYFFFTKKITIGSTIFIKHTILFLNKVMLVSLALFVARELNFSKVLKITFFLFFSLALLSLTDSSSISYFPERHFLYLILIFLIYFNLNPETKLSLFVSSFLLGSISLISLFWWVDIFVFNCLLLISYLIFLYMRNEINKILYVCLGFLITFLTIIYFFPSGEIIFFLDNLYFIIIKANAYTSLVYPSPLFGEDGRATKTLIFFFYSLFLFILLVFKKRTDLSNNLKKFLIFLFLSSLISFLYGLGFSDSRHIIASSGMLMANLIFYHLFFLFSFFNKKTLFKNNFFFSTVVIFFFFFIINDVKHISIKNVLSFKKNVSNFLSLDDDAFLLEKNSNYLELIDYYDSLLKKNECIQVLTDETIIPYLVKRKTCTKFFFYHTLVDKKMQSQFIDELKSTSPRFILYKSDLFSPFNFFNRLKDVDNYIIKNYEFYEKFNYWTFYKLK